LETKPKSYAKDFYIWRYLSQDITPKQSYEAISQVKYLNKKILYRFITKTKDKNLLDYKRCLKLKTSKLIDQKPYCIEIGLSIYDATKLSSKELENTIKKFDDKSVYSDFRQKLQILNSKDKFTKLQNMDKKLFFDIFNQCGKKYRVKYFDKPFSLNLIKKLKDDRQFATTIQLIVTNPKMEIAQNSLLDLNLTKINFDYKVSFLLSINSIKYHKNSIALAYLTRAYKKAYYKFDKDNILFWQYQLTKDTKYLDKLASSWDINIYSLYAKDIKNLNYTAKYSIPQVVKPTSYNTTDPFSWLKVLKDIKKLDKQKLKYYENIFTTKDTLPHLTFLYERFTRYKTSYFILPYEKYLKNYTTKRKAMIYAIARQESRFIPSSISSAYAMGATQIMPFLSKAIAKDLKEPYDIDKQLDIKTNLKYANYQINYLTKKLHNPLFIAYAYNGGIGFTRNILRHNNLFGKGIFEPYLSMELIPYDETKRYGKKVLANYFIYINYLNQKKVRFGKFINQLFND